MPNYVQIDGNKLIQVAEGFPQAPFDDAIEVLNEVVKSAKDYIYEDEKFVYQPQPQSPQPPTTEEALANLTLLLLEKGVI